MIKVPLWRQTPPAIFPVALGFAGLANAWANGATLAGFASWPGDILVGMATAFFGFMAISYIGKFLVRPMVLIEDLGSAPGRAGIGAFAMGFIILSSALLTYMINFALLWWIGVALYIVFGLLSLRAVLNDPPEARTFSPFQYLTFVGLILAAAIGAPTGFSWLDVTFAYFSLAAFLVISLGWVAKMVRVRPPQQLRATVAMILAPVSLFAIAFNNVGVEWLAVGFFWVANITMFVLLILARWMTKGGWTPAWGGFVFPVAAFANMHNMAFGNGITPFGSYGIYVALIVATPIVIYVLYRHSEAWIRGDLAKNTGSAVA